MNTVQSDLAAKFAVAAVLPAHQNEIKHAIDIMVAAKGRYDEVAKRLPSVPWWVVAVIHCMECSQLFSQHLHNGDPLIARTKQVPAGRPVEGAPPFKWEDSAVDALVYDKVNKVTDWSIGPALDVFEKFNGVGYRKRNVPSPYLWSYTNQYSSGKFVRDGVYDPRAVSRQPGVAALLKEMQKRELVQF